MKNLLIILTFNITFSVYASEITFPASLKAEDVIAEDDPALVVEKYYYTGESGIVTGWTGPWPVDQKESINAICEVIFQVDGSTPIDTRHLQRNVDGTLKCPAEISATRKTDAESDDADALAMVAAENAIKCGLKVKARMSVRNASKGLTSTQISSIVTTYSEIGGLLSSGSLVTAREKILLVGADGVMITETDKTALVAELDACK